MCAIAHLDNDYVTGHRVQNVLKHQVAGYMHCIIDAQFSSTAWDWMPSRVVSKIVLLVLAYVLRLTECQRSDRDAATLAEQHLTVDAAEPCSSAF